MPSILLETDRATVKLLTQADAIALSHILHTDHIKAEYAIAEWMDHEKEHGFSVYGIFLKKDHRLCGYCGCQFVEWHQKPEIQFLWDIHRELPNDPNDDLDYETVFQLRNYFFKHFGFKRVFSFVSEKDPRNQNVAEEMDMICEETYTENNTKWLVYQLKSNSPKFLASSGAQGHEPARTAVQTRRERFLNPAGRIKKPRLKPI